jgi:geranyl-CoA carboxylase alpha subunit
VSTGSFEGGILVANRGEIALRVMRTARRLGYCTVAVYAAGDRDAPHAAFADAAVEIASYLDADAILAAARESGAEAIHPGYGFLSERAEFAERCERERIVFIGPSSAAMHVLGDKSAAKRALDGSGVPLVPGYHGAAQDDASLSRAADALGFPVMVKAAAGGGGRGMRHVGESSELASALASARAEAQAAFGDPALLLERALRAPRHVEVQIAADRFGNVVYFGERDCSVQRRFQKLIEETPSPAVDPALRERLGVAAVTVARIARYAGLGTVEFLLDGDGAFYFIEANTRLQVEHPVTEAVAGVDLVEWQIRIARGEPLPLAQDAIRLDGHAIEARLCAEDPAHGFLPQSGTLVRWEAPVDVRVDHALVSGSAISADYDSMIAKLIAHGPTRDDARRTLARALEETVALGVPTNAAFLVACVRDDTFAAGRATTAFIAERMRWRANEAPAQAEAGVPSTRQADSDDPLTREAVALAAVMRYSSAARRSAFGAWTAWSTGATPPATVTLADARDGAVTAARIEVIAGRNGVTAPNRFAVTADEATHHVELPAAFDPAAARTRVLLDGAAHSIAYAEAADRCFVALGADAFAFDDLARVPATARSEGSGDGAVRAPTSGKVLDVRVRVAERVERGAVVVVLHAMKMEHAVAATRGGTVREVSVSVGDQVSLGSLLVALEPDPA